MKIYFMPAWGNTSEQMLEAASYQTPGKKAIWKNIQGVTSINDADWYIVQDYTEPEYERFIVDKGLLDKCLYFSREVPGGGPIKNYDSMKKFSYLDQSSFLFTKWVYPSSVNGGVNLSYDDLKKIRPSEKRQKIICVQSNKRILQGHVLRLKFIHEFCKRNSEIIDLAGSITKDLDFWSFNNKVELKNEDKFETLSEYQYSLAFDNGQYKNYFGTQFTDSLLTWTVPVYWGSPNIEEFFPDGSYINFSVTDDFEINRIVEKLTNTNDYKNRMPSIEKARNLILDKYNMWNVIWEAANFGRTTWGESC